jgi:acetyl esterase/lipase/peptidoglycan/LPS O-acetylase OafA/YrhL
MERVKTRVDELDLLRFVAVLAIVFFHYAFRGYAADAKSLMPYPFLVPVAKYGYLALELVFMVSGFVISMSAANSRFRDFVVSRIVRLYPAFWVGCTLTFLVTLAIGEPRYTASVGQYLVNLTMLAEFLGVPSLDGVYWFLYVQLLLYVLVTAAVFLGGMHRFQWLLVAWLAGELALEVLPIGRFPARVLADYSVCFAAGAQFFLIWSRGFSMLRLAVIVAALGLAITQALNRLPGFERHYHTTMNVWVVGGVIVAAFAVMLLVALRRTGRFSGRWPLAGAISYPLFLMHEYSGYMIFNALYPAVNAHVLLWGTIALMIGAAFVVHFTIEKRLSASLHALLIRLAGYQGILIVIAAVMVLPASILAFGTFAPGIPYVGSIGLWVFTALAGPLMLVALTGAVFALAAARRGARRAGVAIAIAGALTAMAGGVVVASQAGLAEKSGVRVNLLTTVVPRSFGGVSAVPDDTAVYTTAEGHDLRIDIYRPTSGGDTLAPVAIHIHGGGWTEGSRTVKAANLRWLAAHGYLAVSMDYVLATPSHPTWNTAGPQVTCALSWIAANATTYGGDPDRLFAFGESAGGTLALTTAYAAADDAAASSCGSKVPKIRAVAALAPPVDLDAFYQNADPLSGPRARLMVGWYLGGTPTAHPDRTRAVSPSTYITPAAPPTLIVLAEDDRLVPIAGALQFIDRVTQAGVPVRVLRFPLADHGASALFFSVVNQTWLQVLQQHFCGSGGACR